jgi:hypothetical protein
LLLLSHIIQQTHFSLSEMSRSYIRSEDGWSFGRDLPLWLFQATPTHKYTHTHTHTQKLTASSIAQARTFVLSLSTREWHLEKWWKMDLCPV